MNFGAARRHARDIARDVIAILRGSALSMLILLLVGLNEPFNLWIVVNVLLFIPAILAAILWHEAGHALVACAVGMRPYRVVVGVGRGVFETRIRRCRVEINSVLVGGLTCVGSESSRWLRSRFWLTFAAGPLSTIAFIATIVAIRGSAGFEGLSQSFAPLTVLFCAGLVVLAGSAIPMRVKSSMGELRTDAWVLLTLPFWSAERVRELGIAADVFEALNLHNERLLADALLCCDRALRAAPRSYGARLLRASLLIESGDIEQGRSDALALFGDTALYPVQRIAAFNAVAWANLMLDRPELLEEAVTLSSRAVAAHGKVPAFLGTRGFALISVGRFEEGIALATRAFSMNANARSRALNACCVAPGHARLGEGDEARHWLSQAQRLDSECRLVPRVLEAIEKGADPASDEVLKLDQRLRKQHQRRVRVARRKTRGPSMLVLVLALVLPFAVMKLAHCGEGERARHTTSDHD